VVTEPLQFEVVAGGPKLTDVQPRRIILDGGVKEITIVGSGFGDTDDPQHPPNGVMLDDRPVNTLIFSQRKRLDVGAGAGGDPGPARGQEPRFHRTG
jgi:hypothetical protein